VWEQPHNCTIHSSSSSQVIRFKTAVLPICRLTIPALNVAYVGNTCFNCGKLGYCLPDYTLPYAFCAKLKELKELLESDLKDNKHLTDKTGKNTL
jgi:hypothetical protein